MSKLTMDEVVFNRCLRDPGYRVDFVAGTTYSLDFDSFLTLPFSLGFMEEPGEEEPPSPSRVLAALRLCSERLAVFCNYSDIKVPSRWWKVYCALVEDSVFPVVPNAPRKNAIANFHPKVWVVRETSEKGLGSRMKILVMSRNLTRDGSLDCICVLAGRIGSGPAFAKAREKHRPLRDFLHYLARSLKDSGGRAIRDKKRRMMGLIRDVDRVRSFDIEGSDFQDYAFLPMGIRGHSGRGVLEEIASDAREVAVVSPFLDDRTLERFSRMKPGAKLLLTREASVSEKAVAAFGKEGILTMNPRMLDNDLRNSVDLHAKMYFVTSAESSDHYLYLGSANATQGGFDRNVEFLLRLHFAPWKTSFGDFCSYFANDPEGRFVPMTDPNAEDLALKERERRLSRELRRAIDSIEKAVFHREGERWSVALHVSSGPLPDAVGIHPLSRAQGRPLVPPTVTFDGLSLAELSEFFVIRLEGLERVVKIPTEGLDWRLRDEALCRSALGADPRSGILDCIAFYLSDGVPEYSSDRNGKGRSGAPSAVSDGGGSPPPALYERLLRTAYESPNSFQNVQRFVAGLPEDVVPPALRELFDLVEAARKGIVE